MIGITSLDLLAFPLRYTDRLIVAVIDARRGELFYAFYRQVPGGVQRLDRACRRHARRPGRRAAGHGRGAPAGRRRRAALPRARSPAAPASSWPSSGWPTRRRRRWCSWPTPGRCARSGCNPLGARSRSTCASPTPRSTGPRRESRAGERSAASATAAPPTAPSTCASARCGAVTCAAILRSRSRCTPGRGRSALFVSELGPDRDPRATSWPRSGAGRRLRRPAVRARRRARHEHRRRPGLAPPRASAPGCCWPLAREAIAPRAPGTHPRGAGRATRPPRRCTGASASRRRACARATTRAREDAIVMWAHDIDRPAYAARLPAIEARLLAARSGRRAS